MSKHGLVIACALATLAGCAGKMENPTDYYTYRDEPLVKQVEEGMTVQEVKTIGGPPSSSTRRKVKSGTCNNYILTKDGHKQAYHVSFDSSGRVEETGFMTCEQRETADREKAEGSGGGGGY
ncbi:osmotically-inducible lipoprotein OsmE [Metapseudomonas boanensis]|uniref:Osmotically-inducible lipoprotein OsmE n=1 Tax=Metapseudomonas boanensis TaxID=2822138 RepID=A0ABS5XGP5_9GAMM|nr:osmotically-inducible lipoprotein OsmE [Pseudomonas boanensis]MBT8765512.1 osmotically-inducible lipoprotein OsmE [Pseudomonas boanensis]